MFLAQCSFIQAVPCDLSGSGRDECIAFIGICKKDSNSDTQAWVWVYDVLNKQISAPYCMGNMNWIQESDSLGENLTFAYQVQNFISITTGDFDGDGIDSIVAFAACDGNDIKLVEFSAASGYGSTVLTKEAEGASLLHPEYMSDGDAFKELRNKTSADGRYRLGCDLAAEDINSDGKDELAVISYTQQFGDYPDPLLSGEAIVEPYLAVAYCEDSVRTVITSSKTKTQYVASKEGDYLKVPLAPTLSMGDTTLSGYKDIIVSGLTGSVLMPSGAPPSSCPLAGYGDKTRIITYSDSGSESDPLTQGVCADVDTAPGIMTSELRNVHTWPSMGTTAAAVNGPANPVYVFTGGRMYDLSSGSPTLVSGASSPFFEAEIKASDFDGHSGANNDSIKITYISSAYAAPIDGNYGGYEQMVFVAGTT